MSGFIDFHTHAFPANIADKAISKISAMSNTAAYLDGTISSLLASMDKCGIEKSVLSSIATRPEQFNNILQWSRSIASERIIPFLSVHPDDEKALEQIEKIADAGFKGIKLHPYFQRFLVNDEKLLPLYQKIADCGLILLLHAGYDFAYPDRKQIANPKRIADIADKIPGLKMVAAHFGGWEAWDEVEEYIIGRKIYIDTSFAVSGCGKARVVKMIEKNPPRYVLFGTDSPWASQQQGVDDIYSLQLPEDEKADILWRNAAKLLG